MKDRRRTRKPIKPDDTRNLNIVETKREIIKTNVGKDKNISITFVNKIYTNPQQNPQGLVPPQYEPAHVSDLRQAMTGRNIHGARSNTNPFAYSPSPQVFTGATGHPVYNTYNYGHPPPAFRGPPGSADPAPGSADPTQPQVDLGPNPPLFDADGIYNPDTETPQEINRMNEAIKKRKRYLRGEIGNPRPNTAYKYSFTEGQLAKIRVLVAERAAAS